MIRILARIRNPQNEKFNPDPYKFSATPKPNIVKSWHFPGSRS